MIRLDGARGSCASAGRQLSKLGADLTVRRNYPYAGKGDGLTLWFRRHLPPDVYVGIELEVNQKHVFTAGRQWTAMRKVIIESLRRRSRAEVRRFAAKRPYNQDCKSSRQCMPRGCAGGRKSAL